jgi:hypothetical protein
MVHIRRVSPYAMISRPVGAKSRDPVASGSEDRDPAVPENVRVVGGFIRHFCRRTGGWREDPADEEE